MTDKKYDHYFSQIAPTNMGSCIENSKEELIENMEAFEKIKKESNEKGIKPLNVQPLGDKVLLYQTVGEEEKISGGIILTGTIVQESNKATVVAVGTGKMLESGSRVPMEIKVGDEVIFNKPNCMDIRYDGINYKVTSEREIVFIINKEIGE